LLGEKKVAEKKKEKSLGKGSSNEVKTTSPLLLKKTHRSQDGKDKGLTKEKSLWHGTPLAKESVRQQSRPSPTKTEKKEEAKEGTKRGGN